MPYKSKAQIKFMHSQHPNIAKRWDKKYDAPKNLPEHITDELTSRMLKRKK